MHKNGYNKYVNSATNPFYLFTISEKYSYFTMIIIFIITVFVCLYGMIWLCPALFQLLSL
jgi:hypothetical protein